VTAFIRTADDIADHPTLRAGEKLAYPDLLEAELKKAANRRRRRLSHVALCAISVPSPLRAWWSKTTGPKMQLGEWPSSDLKASL
jgi:hypothetical protein